MNVPINLSLFESVRILIEAAATENELFRIIDNEIRKNFFIEGDPTMPAEHVDEVDDVSEIFRTVSAAEARRVTGNDSIPDVEDDGTGDMHGQAAPDAGDGTMSIVDYIRSKAIETLTYPSDHRGCMGIGNSREAKIRLGKLYGSKQKPKPLDPKNPSGKWVLPPENPGTLAKTQYALLAEPDKLPQEFKNYISLLARQYLPGLIRIAFEDCGLAAYLFRRFEPLRRGLISYYAGKIDDRDKLNELVSSEFTAEWDYNRMFHLAHVVIPQLVIKSKIAPVEATPNCDKGLIRQNIDYLGEENVETIQELVDPIEIQLGPNLDLGGTKPLAYRNLLRVADVGGADMGHSVTVRSTNPDGSIDYYVPKSDKDDGDADSQDDHAEYRLSGPDGTLEYPAMKIGEWYVEQIAKGESDKDDYQYGWFAFDGPGAEDSHRFMHAPEYNSERGLGNWCWTRRMLEDYREYNKNDVAYALVHQTALQYNPTDRTGSYYDASAFGIVIAGGKNNYPDIGWIPGLVKSNCFESRTNRTYTEGRPGRLNANTYPESMVPYGGKIPGLVPITKNMSSSSTNIAQAINNSIFSLALIGKWDPSIKVQDEQGNLFPKNLVPLMQRWFPADISDAGTGKLIGNNRRSVRIRSDDINAMAKDIEYIIDTRRLRDETTKKSTHDTGIGEPITDSMFRQNVFQLNGIDYSVIVRDTETLIAIPTEFYVDAAREYNNDPEVILSNLADEPDPPALLFFYPESLSRVIPYSDRPLALSDACSISSVSFYQKLYDNDISRKERRTAKQLPDADGHGIRWFNPLSGPLNRQRRIGVNIDDGAKLFVSGPDTDGNPVGVAGKLPDNLMHFKIRGSYYPVPQEGYNLLVNFQHYTYIGYARNGKTRWFYIPEDTTFKGTDNALLIPVSQTGDFGSTYTLGSITGNLANRMRATMKDRYTRCIDWVSHASFVDDTANLTEEFKNELHEVHGDQIGLCVPSGDFNGDPHKTVGIIDWYDIHTLEYVDTTPVYLDDVERY